jgi:hypothetical protein
MKKSLSALCVLACFAEPAAAATLNLGAAGFNQAQFRAFSEDMGAALSYKAATPAASLGVTGFDVSVGVSSSQLQNSALLQKAGGPNTTSLIVPKLQIEKGLPFNIDIGAFYSAIPTTNISLYGGELRYAILPGDMVEPAVAVRGAFTKLSGVSGWDLSTKSVDLSISKGFAILTPFAGVGSVWTNSSTTGTGLASESFRQNKIFLGANANFGIANFALEYDKTGPVPSYTAKFGFRF